jgi:hypothetical protein
MVVFIDFNAMDVIFGMLYISHGFWCFFRGYCWPSVG